MKALITLGAAVALTTSAVALSPAPRHACAQDALARAPALLKLHFESDGVTLAAEPGAPKDDQSGEAMNWDLDPSVTGLPPVAAPVGKGKLDVLEVTAYIYKATYTMRFSYAQIPDACVLMGQAIMEQSDPY